MMVDFFNEMGMEVAEMQLLQQQTSVGKGMGKGKPQQQTGRKMKLCNDFLAGSCPRGLNCTFAHGDEELGTVYIAPPPGASLKTKLCTHHEGGFCHRGGN